MSITILVIYIVGSLFFGAVCVVGGWFARKRVAERLIRTAESKAREILVTAKREAEDLLKRGERDSKNAIFKAQSEFDNQIAQKKRDLENLQKVLQNKEETLDRRDDASVKKERESAFRLQEAEKKEKSLADRERALERLSEEARQALKRISELDPETAKRELLKRLETELRTEASRLILEIEGKAREEADEKARRILSTAIQRCAATHSMESTVTVVPLPNEEMKGRIIGKDGRNIKTFETLTGVDLVIDETPGAVTLSAFDGVRREIARQALLELMQDGRIQPARIEEVVQKTKKNMENVLREEGEKAVLDANLTGMHPEMVKLLGRLRFRSSYGQNVLDHSVEVAYLMNVIAGEMKLDPILARRAGLLHDIGKAVSSDVEGPHALIGGELARRYGEHPDVVHGIEAHHEDIEMSSVWPMLVQAADAASAARPGARRESLDNYVKRLGKLEEIADRHPGVEKSYAIQGGREVRVIVKPDRVPESGLPALAREISKKIEADMRFPGQIKVIVIRETRVEDVAK
ncbi:MAG TPA: ribonuclease Y [Candidatus Eisenbacteria bacterium]|nr:ribonuclease Y [Candidatus Eisenbacteria bacterium]